MEEEFERIDKENSWTALYQYIRSKAKEFALPHKEARKLSNIHLNRYKDVYPYDHSRICLQRAETDYINASLVPVPEASRSYILTQGPLPATTSHFWAMIWEQKSKAIVMLNRVIEKNIIKCHKYWPSCSEDELILEDVSLKVSNREEEISTDYVIRHLILTDLETNESRVIYHFHYMTWPDFGVPETPEQFLHFLQIVREKGVLDDTSRPAVVHCSAGIGRSGTFCLVDSSLIMIKEAKTLDINGIKDLLLEMRRYRMGLIQTADQLRFSYLAIIEGTKSILSENEWPSLHQKPKVEELQGEFSSESSSDTLSESSEATSEESVSGSDEDDVFCHKKKSALRAEHSQEIQNYVETSRDDRTVESDSSEESESTLDDETSDTIETELDHDKSDAAKAQLRNNQDTETCRIYETANEQPIDEIKDQQNTAVSIDNTSCGNQRCSLETSDLSQQCIVFSLNNTVEETREAVNATEMSDGMKKVSERNEVTLSGDVHSRNEINSVNASLNNSKQPLVGKNVNPSGHSENSKIDESQKVNVHIHCEHGEQCLNSDKHSSDKLSNSFTDQLSDNKCVANGDDDDDDYVSAGIMSRHLEFYQNGDIYSAKEHKCNIANKNSQSQKDRNAYCDNAKNNINHASQCSFRSSSCPRQLPSISARLQYSRVDGDTQKRRNSTELGHLSDDDGTIPQKFQKMHEDHRNAEPQIVEELAIIEDACDESTCEDKAKEPLLRSKR